MSKSDKNTINKTIFQYSEKLSEETMVFLRGIADDYCKVKNYVYNRYSGINSIDKLNPGYDVLNEMRSCGLRKQLKLPVVYYELAIFDALTDIKTMWAAVKNKIRELTNVNPNLSDDDKSYVRIVLRIDSVYIAILQNLEYKIPNKAEDLSIDTHKLNNLIKRLSRKYRKAPGTDAGNSFKVSPNGYSYKNGGIKLVSRVDRKRVFIPLRDSTPYKRQLNVIVKDDFVILAVPVTVQPHYNEDYINMIFLHIGYKDMCTLSNGNIYGADLNTLVTPETERLRNKNINRHVMYSELVKSDENGELRKSRNIRKNNLGKLKYNHQKQRKRAETEAFINGELNRMIEIEKPAIIVTTAALKYKPNTRYTKNNKIIYNRSYYGYIRERLVYKCKLNGIELVQINSKDTGSVCASCGAVGKRNGPDFICEVCGASVSTALNTAKNIQAKYLRN